MSKDSERNHHEEIPRIKTLQPRLTENHLIKNWVTLTRKAGTNARSEKGGEGTGEVLCSGLENGFNF